MKLSRSAKYYRDNEEAREKKNAYQKKFNKKREQVKKRVELITWNRKNNAERDGLDASHKGNRIVGQSTPHRNRGSKVNAPGDRRARGRKR